MNNYCVIGDPVAHSRSPGMQNAAFEFHGLGSPYMKRHVKPEELAGFAAYARKNLAGFNCTVPHKKAIIPFLDEIDPEAAAAESVNTVLVENGRMSGFSTDGYGLEMALRENFGLSLAGKTVLFAGTGGAASATSFHFARQGVKAILLANRTVAKAEELAGKLRRFAPGIPVETAPLAGIGPFLKRADILIQATSLGLSPEDPPPFDLGLLEQARELVIFDTIYKETPLLRQAAELGIPSAGGLAMLLYQGAKSFELWTRLPAPIEEMRAGMTRNQ